MTTVSISRQPIKSTVSRAPTAASGGSKSPFFTLIEPGINSAITRGLFQQVRFLVQFGTEVNERDGNRCTPLIHCAMIEDEQWAVGIARMLIEKGAVIGFRDKKGVNALHYACLHNRLELVKVYLSAVDFDVNQGDAFGNTALHYAVSVGNTEMVRLLLEILLKYELTIDPINKKAITPLMIAYKCGNTECAKLLIDFGADNEDFKNIAECTLDKDSENECLVSNENLEEINGHPKLKLSETLKLNNPLKVRGANPFQKQSSGRPQSSRPASRGNKSCEDNEQEFDVEEGLLSRVKYSDRLYRAASLSELRNRPDLVFDIDPIQCVVNGTNSHPKIPVSPRKLIPVHPFRPGSGQMRIPTSWRCEMKKLYGAFEFQFTKSFVAGVKPLPPEPEPSSEDSLSLRPSSAFTTESMSGSVSDIASVCSKRSNVSARKISGVHPPDGRKRKTSMVPQTKKRQQALLTLRTDSDTSSEASGFSRRKVRDTEISDGASPRKGSLKSRTAVIGAFVKTSN